MANASPTSRHSERLAVAYYSPAEAAALLGISIRTTRTMISDGTLRAVRIGPKLVRIPAEALDDAIRPYAANRAGDAA